MKHGSYAVSIVAAAVLLVACGSSPETAGSATAGSSVAGSASSSESQASTSASATRSSATVTATISAPATSSADDSSPAPTGTAEVDAQTYAWFDTFCTGVAPFGDLSSSSASTAQEVSALLTTIGTTFTDTANKLAALPPPTFDGGEEVAQQLVTNMQEGGPVFTEFGQKALLVDTTDQAAGQQFQAEFQAAVAALGISNFTPPAAARAAVQAVPSCEVLGS